MTATTSAVESYQKARELGLSPLPVPGTYHEGYEWMDKIGSHGWSVVSSWGSDGWNLGNWPYVIVAVSRRKADGERPDLWASVVYVEGDLELRVADTYEQWVEQIGRTAHFYWRSYEDGPKPLASEFEKSSPAARMPYYDGGFPQPEETA